MASFINLLDQRRLIGPGGSTVSGSLAFYYTGTSILAPIYNDASMSIPSENPVEVGAGEPIPSIFLDSDIVYRRVITYSDGTYDETDPLGSLFSDQDVGLPVGAIIDFSGPAAPDGFLFCAGQAVNRVTYADLFNVIGTQYGAGNGTTTFNVPDYRGRVLAGKDNMGGSTAGRLTGAVDGTVLGAAGGESAHALTVDELASHTHGVNDPGHGHSYNQMLTPGTSVGNGTNQSNQTTQTGSATTGITIQSTGLGTGHNNIQPTMVSNKIIKVSATTFLSLLGISPDFTNKANASAVGVAPTDNNMGLFSGSIIPDNTSAKVALQSLETVLDNYLLNGAAAVSFIQLGTGANIRTVQDELRETVKISQFYAGGVSDGVALQRAINKLTADGTGGVIELQQKAYSDPYIIDAVTISQLTTSGTNPITLRGQGKATPIQVASACTNFITLNGAWGGIEDVMILDPNNYCSQAYIYIQPSTGFPSLERFIHNVKVIGPGTASTAYAIVNNGGQKIRMSYIDVQNVSGLYWNQGGGVDTTLDMFYALGTQFGIRLDTNVTYGHSENFKASRGTLLCTQANSRGILISDSLHVGFTDVICGQLGSGGIGMEIAPGVGQGAVLTELVNVYLEGSNTGVALRSRGTNREFKMIGGGFGQGGYTSTLINCIDFDASSNFVFDGTVANFPAGNCNKVATITNSTGVITETNKGWANAVTPSTDATSAIQWELFNGEGLPTVRSTASSYPNASWSTWTPTVTSASGTITTVGTTDCTYVRRGKSVSFRISVTITTNGTGAGSIFVTLPVNVVTSKFAWAGGVENGVSGALLNGLAFGNGITIRKYDNTYPGANGAILILQGEYESV